MHWRSIRSRVPASPFVKSVTRFSRDSFLPYVHRTFRIGSSPREAGLILGYGLAALPIALLNNIWVTYNYPFFVGGVLADSSLFLIVQFIFLVWNSVNDPLFGWISDHTSTSKDSNAAFEHPSMRRIQHIRRAGVYLGASFLFAWFPWSLSNRWLAALHFLLSLSFYDAALTYIEVNYASLLADLSNNAQTRAWCNSASSIFSIFGAVSSFFAHIFYFSTSSEGPSWQFKFFCLFLVVGLAIPAAELSMRTVMAWTHEEEERVEIQLQQQQQEQQQLAAAAAASASASPDATSSISDSPELTEKSGITNSTSSPSDSSNTAATTAGGDAASGSNNNNNAATTTSDNSGLTFRLFVKQLLSHRNFALFCGMRLLQVFLCTFEKNHLSSFLDILLGDQLSQSFRGMLISLSFILPHVLLLWVSAYIRYWGGVYSIIRSLLVTKIFAAVLMLTILIWTTQGGLSITSSFTANQLLPMLLLCYLCGSRIVTECVCRLFPLVVSNLVDEDRVTFTRSSSMAATLIGTSSLLAKPGESLAPMLGWKVLNLVANAGDEPVAVPAAAETTVEVETKALESIAGQSDAKKQALLYLLLSLPLLTVSLQLLLWSFFSLHGSYLKRVTQRVKELDDAATAGGNTHHHAAEKSASESFVLIDKSEPEGSSDDS